LMRAEMSQTVRSAAVLVVGTNDAAVNFFFFSSRRRHTRSKRDWSSDVCSSDLHAPFSVAEVFGSVRSMILPIAEEKRLEVRLVRSEERRVGKECRSRWSRDQ